jgi:hypothetical protein
MKALGTALIATLVTVSADASVARFASFDDKVEKASQIVLAKCVKQRAEWDSAHRWILTYSTFNVEKSYKGDGAQEVTVITPGGVVGEVHQATVGMPAFREGQDNVLFVRNTAVGPTVLYFEQGAYDVVRDDRNNRIVQPVMSDSVHVDTQRGMAVAPESARPLRTFETEVQTSLRRQAAQRMELIRARQKEQQPPTIVDILQRNKLLVALAMAGIALATWHLIKR